MHVDLNNARNLSRRLLHAETVVSQDTNTICVQLCQEREGATYKNAM
jgi:hypothetical protein